MSMSTPAASSADRRRSGRGGTSAKKSYADRDDSEDDQEMWDGVAQWEYDEGNRDGAGSEAGGSDKDSAGVDDVEEEEVEEVESKDATPDHDEEQEEPEEATPPPPKRGRPAKKPAATTTTKLSPTASKPAAAAKQKPKPALVVGRGKVKKVEKKTAPVVEKPRGGKSKAKASKPKDIFDMDDSD